MQCIRQGWYYKNLIGIMIQESLIIKIKWWKYHLLYATLAISGCSLFSGFSDKLMDATFLRIGIKNISRKAVVRENSVLAESVR